MERAEALRTLCWSVPAALVGEVTPNLVSVTAGVDGNTIRVIFYYDGPPSDDDIETARVATTEVIADFPPQEGWMIAEDFYDVRERPERPLDMVLFKRRPQTPYE
jgi:hypothetical protein